MTMAVAGLMADIGPGSVPGEFAATVTPGCGKYCSAKIGAVPPGPSR
jgi:hypothetical protein